MTYDLIINDNLNEPVKNIIVKTIKQVKIIIKHYPSNYNFYIKKCFVDYETSWYKINNRHLYKNYSDFIINISNMFNASLNFIWDLHDVEKY